MDTSTIVILSAVGVVLLSLIIIYNSLIVKRNDVKNASATIDVMLKKRFDLIPNIVAVVRKYSEHEADTLAQVTKLRSQNFKDLSIDEKTALNAQFNQGTQMLGIAIERYPDLKASTNFMHLQRTINQTEEELSAARRTYNAHVTSYNTATQVFPSNVIANMLNFKPEQLFEATAGEKAVVEVKF